MERMREISFLMHEFAWRSCTDERQMRATKDYYEVKRDIQYDTDTHILTFFLEEECLKVENHILQSFTRSDHKLVENIEL